MFGYIVPVSNQLTEEENSLFKAAYCGLCECLTQEYGRAAGLFLNYDFVFLTLLLSGGETLKTHSRRCPYNCLRRKSCLQPYKGMQLASAMSVILSYWKLQDSIKDECLLLKPVYGILALLLRRGYHKAARLYPEYDRLVREKLSQLQGLEAQGCSSMDYSADCFAQILQGSAMYETAERKEALSLLLYHIGRWIYLVDARDDLAKDIKKHRYNPLIGRFSEEERKNGAMDQRLCVTLLHSRNMAGSALEALEKGQGIGILQNIIYFGLPSTAKAVFSGQWRRLRTKKQRKAE